MNIKIMTDSTADIPQKVAEQYGITVVSLDVIMDGQPRKAVDVTESEFYDHLNDCLANGKPLPTTSQVTMVGFEDALRPYANAEDTFVLLLTIAKEMSNTYNSAAKAIESLEMKNVYLFDTYVTTFGLGALVVEIAKLAQQPDMTVEKLIEQGEDLNSRVWTYVSIGDLRCLRAGGRLSAAAMALGSMLRLKPIVHINKKVEIATKTIGQGKANKWIAERVAEERDTSLPLYLGSAKAPELIDKLTTQYAQLLGVKGDEMISSMGPVVGTHAGPGCVGVAFFKKK